MDFLEWLPVLFGVSTNTTLLLWGLLAFAPASKWTSRAVYSGAGVAALSLLYVALRVGRPPLPPGAGLESFHAFHIAVTDPYGALVTWVHILAVDLLAGAWIVADSRLRGVRHLWVVPCLAVTLVAAPMGLLAWLGVRRLGAQASPA